MTAPDILAAAVRRALSDPHPLWLLTFMLITIVAAIKAPLLAPLAGIILGCMAGEKDATRRVRDAIAAAIREGEK